jgi:uncharacterized protein (TIGR02118 family)
MAKILVLYGKPADPAAFDAYYANTHVPIAKKLPGLKRYEVSAGPVAAPDGSTPYHLVATLEFDTMEAMVTALQSPEGRATAEDVSNFADGGAQVLVFETREV